MLSMFIEPTEALDVLGRKLGRVISPDELQGFVRGGRLREFPDGTAVLYKRSQVETLAAELLYERPCSMVDARAFLDCSAEDIARLMSEGHLTNIGSEQDPAFNEGEVLSLAESRLKRETPQ